MRRKGAYHGFKGGHIEYHTVDPKKEKPADCVYLIEGRECQNKKSPQFQSKCFHASCCKYRLKREDEIRQKQINDAIIKNKKEKIVEIKCSISMGYPMYSPALGKGNFVGFDPKTKTISVKFGNDVKLFQYPQAILDKFLVVPDHIYELVCKDKAKAKIELI